jgi:murein DD-endopeptidase MepM/ murein hydrolase activator NlpD
MLVVILLSALLVGLLGPSGPAEAAPQLPVSTSWPLEGRPDVVRGFDPPDQPWGPGHRGVDLAGGVGADVLAAAAGTISYAGMLAGRGVVVVQHGPLRTTFEPVLATVEVGEAVAAGQPVGTLAAGGHCKGCLHWGLREGEEYLDPLLLAPDDRVSADYRLVPATERDAVEQRISERDRIHGLLPPELPTGPGGLGPAGSHGFNLPLAAPITSPYGMRFHPVLQRWKLHDGTDFGAGCGTPIRAPYDGTVSAAYFNGGYGNRLMIDHGTVDGHHVITGFNHATSYVVGVGDDITKGQLIGYVGTTGYSTGCHLHLMVWLGGSVVDPMSWF